jgi:endonuclease/exonuclease/phosphatase family metal-dependent hydrolase
MIRKIIILVFVLTLLSACSSSHQNFIPKINDRVVVDESKDEISIITYNIQALWSKEDEEVESLIEYLNETKYDFITMQELFDEDTRDKLIKNLDSLFYKSLVPRVDYNCFPSNLSQDAGLFSASRYPIIDLSKYNFGEDTEFSNGAIHQMLPKFASISLDFLANKSVMGSLHHINDSTKLFLFTTHLQLFSSIFHKAAQLKQIHSFIENAVSEVLKNSIVSSSENLIVLLTGDLNYNAYSEEDTKTVKHFLGNPRDLHKEFNGEIHEYTKISEWIGLYGRFDYIFTYDSIGSMPLRRVNISSINVTDIVTREENSVSDHFAIIASLKIEN